jgi:ELWxxDGT repeat protein
MPGPVIEIAPGLGLFFASLGGNDLDLWRTDGTFFGTERVAELNPAPVAGCSLAGPMTVFDGALFFSADCGSDAGYELWRSDGTAPGTMRFDLNPGAAHSLPRHFTTIGDLLYFVADGPGHAGSLFATDGTPAGTYELYDYFFAGGPTVSSLVNYRGRLFAAAGGAADLELWSSDGTIHGTYRVQDIHPSGSANVDLLTVSGGRLFFSANDGVSGFELWATDTLFDDGFEARVFLPVFTWSSHTNGCAIGCDLGFTIPGLEGGASMQATVNDTEPLYVQDDTPDGEAEYHARFLFDPNGFDPGEALGRHRTRILLAFSAEPQRRLLTLVLARNNGAYRIILRTRRDDGTTVDLPGVPITDEPHAIEVAWKRASAPGAADGAAELWIDEVLMGTLTGVDNDTGAIDFVRLGAMSVKPGAAGALVYDRFESRRFRHVGP